MKKQSVKPAAKLGLGLIDPSKIRVWLFALATACLGICVVISILAIWRYVGSQSAFKTMASCGVLFAGALLFDQLNKKFG